MQIKRVQSKNANQEAQRNRKGLKTDGHRPSRRWKQSQLEMRRQLTLLVSPTLGSAYSKT